MDHYYLLGRNVSASLSPVMMNTAFKVMDVDAGYTAISVAGEDFQERFLDLREKSSGMNITIPYKSDVIPFLDGLDELSGRIRAVNVTKREGERYLGFNTDVHGIVAPLREHRREKGVERALLLGAGGAARAFCAAMEQIGCGRVSVAVRDVERGRSFVQDVSRIFPSVAFEVEALEALERADYQLVFNATPIGSNGVPLPDSMKRVIYGGQVVFDAVYRPMETELLTLSRSRGCDVIYGYEMLLHQGAAALERWLGRPAPVEIMRQALQISLGAGS